MYYSIGQLLTWGFLVSSRYVKIPKSTSSRYGFYRGESLIRSSRAHCFSNFSWGMCRRAEARYKQESRIDKQLRWLNEL